MQMFARCCATSNSTSPELPLPPPSLPQTSLGIGFEHLVGATFNRHMQAKKFRWVLIETIRLRQKRQVPPKVQFLPVYR